MVVSLVDETGLFIFEWAFIGTRSDRVCRVFFRGDEAVFVGAEILF